LMQNPYGKETVSGGEDFRRPKKGFRKLTGKKGDPKELEKGSRLAETLLLMIQDSNISKRREGARHGKTGLHPRA